MEVNDMATIKDHIFTVINDHKDEIYTKFNVETLSIFGSVAKETAGADSDVDILVSYKETPGFFEFLNLKEYLEAMIGRRVDLVTKGGLKKQLRKQITEDAIRVA
jgi:predicted nucleotidyltransferase